MGTRGSRTRISSRESLAALLMLLPALLLGGIFFAYPILNTIWLSFNDVDRFGRVEDFVGLDNYFRVIADEAFQASLWRTLIWTIGVVAITTGLALFLAVMLNRRFPGRAIVRGLLLLPWAASLVVTTLLWRWMANPDFGAIGRASELVGLDLGRVEWLANAQLSFPLMMWIAIWVSLPPTTLILLAGLQSIPGEIYEAASLDNARGMRTFIDMTLPMLRPLLALSILLNVIFVFNSFPIIWVLTEGGPAGQTNTLVTYLYTQGFRLYDMGGAAAVSVVMFLLLLTFAIVHTRFAWKSNLES